MNHSYSPRTPPPAHMRQLRGPSIGILNSGQETSTDDTITTESDRYHIYPLKKTTFLTRLSGGNPVSSRRWEKFAFQPGAELYTSHPLSFQLQKEGYKNIPTTEVMPEAVALVLTIDPPLLPHYICSSDRPEAQDPVFHTLAGAIWWVGGLPRNLGMVREKNVRNEKVGSPPALKQLGPG